MMPPQKMKHFSGTPVLTPIARADLSARSVPTMTFSSEKASRNGCNGRQKGGFPAAGSFAIASLSFLFIFAAIRLYSGEFKNRLT